MSSKSSFYAETGISPQLIASWQQFVDQAEIAATAALVSETDAAASQTSASSSASSASTSAANSATSAAAAAGSATAAAASATGASTSASTATTQATNASSSAGAAASSATAASTSATNAATSATAAAGSASAASTSATNAANSATAAATSAAALPTPSVANELDYFRVNPTGTAVETRTPAQTWQDILTGSGGRTAATARTDLGVGYGAGLKSDGSGNITMDAASATYQHAGRVAQVVNVETGAVATGTTVIPLDDTIPQNTEGDQYMALAITPTNASSALIVDVVMHLASSAAGALVAALFQDATANALATAYMYQAAPNNAVVITFRHKMIAGTTSATTFKARAGNVAAGTTTFNGSTAARAFGGTLASSITITEILP